MKEPTLWQEITDIFESAPDVAGQIYLGLAALELAFGASLVVAAGGQLRWEVAPIFAAGALLTSIGAAILFKNLEIES